MGVVLSSFVWTLLKKKPSLDHQGTLEVPDFELCLNKLYLIPKYKYFVQWL